MSLDLILGLGGIVSLGHAVFFGISAYTIGLAARFLTSNLFLQIGLALFVSAFAALVLGWLLLRSRGVYFMMLTIAFSQVFRAIAHSWRSVTGGGDGLSNIARPGWMTSVETFYYLTLLVFIATFVFLRFFVNSRIGISLVGIRESEKRMTSLGYNVDAVKLLSFVVSGGLGGVAGLLYVYFNGYASPEYFSVDTSAQAITMIILGGAGTLIGPVIGAFFVVYMQNILSAVMERWTLIIGIMFVLVVICAPAGVMGLWRKQWYKFREEDPCPQINGPLQKLRWTGSAGRSPIGDLRGRITRPDRIERSREDDAVRHYLRVHQTDPWPDSISGSGNHVPSSAPARPPGNRPDLSDHDPFPRHQRPRQPAPDPRGPSRNTGPLPQVGSILRKESGARKELASHMGIVGNEECPGGSTPVRCPEAIGDHHGPAPETEIVDARRTNGRVGGGEPDIHDGVDQGIPEGNDHFFYRARHVGGVTAGRARHHAAPGKILTQGSVEQVQNNREVQRIYFGYEDNPHRT